MPTNRSLADLIATDAGQRYLADAIAEAVFTLRMLLHSRDEKVRRDAAKLLIEIRAGHITEPTSRPARVTHPETHTHDHATLHIARRTGPPTADDAASGAD